MDEITALFRAYGSLLNHFFVGFHVKVILFSSASLRIRDINNALFFMVVSGGGK